MEKKGKYEHKYKYGKQQELISISEFKDLLEKSSVSWIEKAYLWLLYYTGVRKSEAYERVASDIQVTEEHFIIDFHQRKKHGAKVPPIRIRIYWPGVDLLIRAHEKADKMKRPIKKSIFVYEITDQSPLIYHKRLKKKKPKKIRVMKIMKDRWLFPDIGSTSAWALVKKVLGDQYYPHFLRLNRITELCSDPKMSITILKSYTGIKSIPVLNDYLGTSRKEQEKAIEYIDRQISAAEERE